MLTAAALPVLLLGALVAPSAFAAPSNAESVTWSARPADQDGRDGRSWVEVELDPGATHRDHLAIENFSASEVTFQVYASDGYFTDTGRFNMRPSTETPAGAGAWITVDDAVTVPAGETVILPFDVEVPENAPPGDHPAGIAVAIHSAAAEEGSAVGVESRTGFRVMTRVTGELQPAISAAATAIYAGSWNPFEPGTVRVEYQLVNTGNTRLEVQPDLSLAGPFGAGEWTQELPAIEEIAPGERRTAVVEDTAWPLGLVDVRLGAVADVLPRELGGATVTTTVETRAVAVPWSQLATLLAGGALVGLHLAKRRRDRQRVEQLISAARAEGMELAKNGGVS